MAAGPDRILQTATGFWASKVLMTAVEFDIFTLLQTRGSATALEIADAVGIHKRPV